MEKFCGRDKACLVSTGKINQKKANRSFAFFLYFRTFNRKHMLNNLKIDSESEIPKYKQVVDLFISDIEAGIFKQGQRIPVSYTHLRAHETRHDLVCRLLLEKKK